MKLFFLILFLTAYQLQIVQAQQGQFNGGLPKQQHTAQGNIYGSVVDKSTQKALPYVIVALIKTTTDSIAASTITNVDGQFALEHLPLGIYKLKFQFIGYTAFESESFSIQPDALTKHFRPIELSLANTTLATTQINADKNVFINGIDKKIFNVDKNIIATGGNANDVLQQIPSVTVDIDGNIALRGNSNVTILIDGKPSTLTGDARLAALKSIPGSSIESIELITNPSAKYSAEGMGGIINVVMKKNKVAGWNGLVQAGIGTGKKYTGGFNFSYKEKRMNLFLNYNYRDETKYGSGKNFRTNLLSDTSYSINQTSTNLTQTVTKLFRAGSDFYLDEKNTLGFVFTYNPSEEKSPENNNYEFLNEQNQVVKQSYRNNLAPIQSNFSAEYNMNYRHQFNQPKQELTGDLTYSNSQRSNANHFLEDVTFPSTPSLIPTYYKQEQYVRAQNNILNSQIDYTQPVARNAKIELGGRLSTKKTDAVNNTQDYQYPYNQGVDDSALSSHYLLKEIQNAAYFTYTGAFASFLYSGGLRSEYTKQDVALLSSSQQAKVRYWYFFPSAFIRQPLPGGQTVQLSFSRRINRPEAKQLIPFTDYSDPQNKRIGNPNLLPELINVYEASFLHNRQNFNISATAFFRHSTNLVIRYRQILADGTSLMSFQNAATSDNYGIEITTRNTITKWWDVNGNLNLFRTKVNATNLETDLQNNSYSWFIKANNSIRFWKNAMFQFTGTYNGPMILAQGRSVPTLVFSAGVRKDFFKNNFSVSINANDITNQQRMEFETKGTNFTQNMLRKKESRIVMLNLSYRIGNGGQSDSNKKAKSSRPGGMESGGGEDF